MHQIAIKMLFGDRGRSLGIILGITFAALVITQQASIFFGLMSRTFAFISDTGLPDIWVMDDKVQFVDDTKPLPDTALERVRSVPGVLWAVPMYRGVLKVRLPSGVFQSASVVGLDDASLVGGPADMVMGSLEDLRKADGIIVDEAAAKKRLGRRNPDGSITPLAVGDVVEINDRRAVVVGIARTTRAFQSQPLIYTSYTRALSFAPPERRLLSFVLVKAKQVSEIPGLSKRINEFTGLAAYSAQAFKDRTIDFYLKNTGIPINFGIAVALGFIVGAAIAGQTFNAFTADNLRYFGALKAMGATNQRILRMIVLQAFIVGLLGYGIGVGLASLFFYVSRNSELAFFLPWQLLLVTGVAVLVICTLSAVLSIWKVFRLEPAVVFR